MLLTSLITFKLFKFENWLPPVGTKTKMNFHVSLGCLVECHSKEKTHNLKLTHRLWSKGHIDELFLMVVSKPLPSNLVNHNRLVSCEPF